MPETVTIGSIVKAPISKVWQHYTLPEHITHWNFASTVWHCPKAENDLKTGGRFNYRMEAKNGNEGFDFEGVYTQVIEPELIEYIFGERKARVLFQKLDQNSTKIIITFEAETENPIEMQRQGWQSILDNFKNYTEAN